MEADGIYGHFRKRDIKRDFELMMYPMLESILRIEETTYFEIKEIIWQALNKLIPIES